VVGGAGHAAGDSHRSLPGNCRRVGEEGVAVEALGAGDAGGEQDEKGESAHGNCLWLVGNAAEGGVRGRPSQARPASGARLPTCALERISQSLPSPRPGSRTPIGPQTLSRSAAPGSVAPRRRTTRYASSSLLARLAARLPG